MHEAALAQAILDTVLKNVSTKSKKITQINIVAGKMSSIVKESLDLYFSEFSKETIASNAILNLDVKPISKTFVESVEVEDES